MAKLYSVHIQTNTNPYPADPGYTLHLQTVQNQTSWLEEANWSGSALFAIKY